MGNFLLDEYKIENISFHEMKKLKRELFMFKIYLWSDHFERI